jgi:hypothetical protein
MKSGHGGDATPCQPIGRAELRLGPNCFTATI